MEPDIEPTLDQVSVPISTPAPVRDYAPGTLIAGRYRIVSLLGRGGMGEVYRADDLILGQSVALKFLPALLADANHLARFRQEVALARKVAHPHVCRVHDIGEHDGRPFLSMEFIDGEDLASLLKRVGRVAEEKALEVARQLCGALAALHDQGLLHRDLKPANVMLDGRGAVRLADFGLMAFDGNVADVLSGTPLYMAPEQLAGKEVTRQSDLFALGLVLFEVFTGKRAFPAASLAELAKMYAGGSPSKPSSHVAGLNAGIERILLRCLEVDPAARPRSANEILSALPGDLLAAAEAEGVVPSPDLVANATAGGELSPRAGILALGGLVLALALTLFLAPYATLLGRYPPKEEPAVLRNRAKTILTSLEVVGTPADWAHGFAFNDVVLSRVARSGPCGDDWFALGQAKPPPVVYWYRESGQPLLMLRVPSTGQNEGMPTVDEPALEPGSARVRLDRFGHLVGFDRILAGATETAVEPDWSQLFSEADLPFRNFRSEIEPATTAPVPADRSFAWVGADSAEKPLRVEAATYRGHAVYFAVIGPPGAGREGADPAQQILDATVRGFQFLFIAMLGLATVLAWKHCRAGQADVTGALRLGLVTLGLYVVSMVRYHHVFSLSESDLILCGLYKAVFVAVVVTAVYLGLEPSARRNRPRALISWTRLLAGRFRDPLVGRDLLLGILGGGGDVRSLAFASGLAGLDRGTGPVADRPGIRDHGHAPGRPARWPRGGGSGVANAVGRLDRGALFRPHVSGAARRRPALASGRCGRVVGRVHYFVRTADGDAPGVAVSGGGNPPRPPVVAPLRAAGLRGPPVDHPPAAVSTHGGPVRLVRWQRPARPGHPPGAGRVWIPDLSRRGWR